MADSSVKSLKEGAVPHNGDLLKYDSTVGGWIPTTLDAELAGATVIGAYTLPTVDGSDGDVLSTNGAGVLAWITP